MCFLCAVNFSFLCAADGCSLLLLYCLLIDMCSLCVSSFVVCPCITCVFGACAIVVCLLTMLLLVSIVCYAFVVLLKA